MGLVYILRFDKGNWFPYAVPGRLIAGQVSLFYPACSICSGATNFTRFTLNRILNDSLSDCEMHLIDMKGGIAGEQ
jgi:hypothetical protein